MSRASSLKVLDFAMTGADGGENANKFIEILGLRSLFPLFMKVRLCSFLVKYLNQRCLAFLQVSLFHFTLLFDQQHNL